MLQTSESHTRGQNRRSEPSLPDELVAGKCSSDAGGCQEKLLRGVTPSTTSHRAAVAIPLEDRNVARAGSSPLLPTPPRLCLTASPGCRLPPGPAGSSRAKGVKTTLDEGCGAGQPLPNVLAAALTLNLGSSRGCQEPAGLTVVVLL